MNAQSRFTLPLLLFAAACSGTDEPAPLSIDASVADAAASFDGSVVDAGVLLDAGTADAGLDPKAEAIVGIVEPMVDEAWFPSVAVAWYDDGATGFLGFGDTGAPSGPPSSDTLYEIGSITKTFTGVLLGDMVDRGELRLTSLVSQHLPSEVVVPSFNGTPIQLVHLATHFSGLPRMPDNFAPADPDNPFVDYTEAQLYDFLSGYRLRFEPGRRFDYSNLGVALLGHAMARTATVAYADLLEARVLDPLGLDDTVFTLDTEQRTRLAAPFDADGRPSSNWDLGLFDPAGGLKSSTDQMMRYARAVMERADLQGAFDLALTPHATIDSVVSIGLNWFIVDGVLLFHDGATGGYTTFLAVVPAERRALVILTNASSYRTGEVGFAALAALRGLPYTKPDPLPTVVVPEAVLTTFEGRYEHSNINGAFLDMSVIDGALHVAAPDQEPSRLYAVSDRRFYARVVDARFVFPEPDAQGVVPFFTLLQAGSSFRYERR